MEKSEFIIVFPNLGMKEEKVLANSMHIEQVAAVVMIEHNQDLLICKFNNEILFFATLRDKKLHYFYKDTKEVRDVYIVYGADYAIAELDEVLYEDEKERNYDALSDFEYKFFDKRFFYREEADRYCEGFSQALNMADEEDNYRIVDEEVYHKLKALRK